MLRLDHDREFNLEACVMPCFARDRNCSAVIPDNAEADREAETCTARIAARRIAQFSGSLYAAPAYVAPEMLKATRAIDHRADLYSLGVTWFELLCDRLPFRSGSVMELLRLQQTAPLRPRACAR